MFFFFRKPTVIIEAFLPSFYSFACEYAPVEKASKFIPSWFKEIPTVSEELFLKIPIGKVNTNVKGCPGVINSLTNGFIIPIWSDLRLDWDNNNFGYHYSDGISSVISHHNSQMGNFANDFWILKVESPWIFKSSKDTSFTSLPLTYHLGLDSPFKTLHGIQEGRLKNRFFNTAQFFFLKKTNVLEKHLYKFRTPLIHYVADRKFNYKVKCIVDDKVYFRFKSSLTSTSFNRIFYKQKLVENSR